MVINTKKYVVKINPPLPDLPYYVLCDYDDNGHLIICETTFFDEATQVDENNKKLLEDIAIGIVVKKHKNVETGMPRQTTHELVEVE